MDIFSKYIISKKGPLLEDAFTIQLKPVEGNSMSFLPGQYVKIKNPKYQNPEETHFFSFASSPDTKDYLEFCIKIYGLWTQAVSNLKVGDALFLSHALGEVTWKDEYPYVVFLVGGAGIAPIMSILRTIESSKRNTKFFLLYGSRTEEEIIYRNEIDTLLRNLPNGRVVHILSHLKPEDSWKGLRGFITEELLQKEIELSQYPVLYMYGPPIFLSKMTEILTKMGVNSGNIKQELH